MEIFMFCGTHINNAENKTTNTLVLVYVMENQKHISCISMATLKKIQPYRLISCSLKVREFITLFHAKWVASNYIWMWCFGVNKVIIMNLSKLGSNQKMDNINGYFRRIWVNVVL